MKGLAMPLPAVLFLPPWSSDSLPLTVGVFFVFCLFVWFCYFYVIVNVCNIFRDIHRCMKRVSDPLKLGYR